MAKGKIKEERIKCAECTAKKVHLDKNGHPFLSWTGQPILYECPRQYYAFGAWNTIADCKYFRRR